MTGFKKSRVGKTLTRLNGSLASLKRKKKAREIVEVCDAFQGALSKVKAQALALYAENLRLKRKATELHQAVFRAGLQSPQLSPEEIEALRLVCATDEPVNAASIAFRLGISQPQAAWVLGRLAEGGYIQKSNVHPEAYLANQKGRKAWRPRSVRNGRI